MTRLAELVTALCGAIVISSCSGAGGHEGGVLRQVQEHDSPNHNGGARIDAAFETDALVAVDLKGQRFAIRSRQAEMDKFPCHRCHKVPLAQMKHDGKDGKPRAHWNVKLKHADDQVMSCSTCHLQTDLNQLRTLENKPVSLDSSYRTCAQCHSKQASDWAGGAHGKRVGGWAPPRVAKTCVECHNPHGPAWDHRYPARVARREDKPGHE
jgi:hypothetical protein